MRTSFACLFVFGLTAIASPFLFADDMTLEIESNLRAGVAKVDITPAEVENVRAAGHSRIVNGERDPVRAGVLLLDNGKNKAGIVTTDLLAAHNDLVRELRKRIAAATGTPEENLMIAASHNHSGPRFDVDSSWGQEMIAKITAAAEEAAANMRPVSVGYAEDEIDFGINRRGIVNGKALVRLDPNGPNDPRVKVLRFDDGRGLAPMAVLMHAVCHPCFFTWGDNVSEPYPNGYPKMSADFPGEAQTFVESVYGGATNALFLQGCAGDIRPNLPGYPYRCADEADLQWAGRSLGGAVVRALARSMIREELSKRKPYYRLECARSVVELPGKEGPVEAELQAMMIGPYLLLTMPGEPMVEYGFKLEAAIADRAVPIIVGYANGSIGYIATADAYQYGGYEPNSSRLAPEAEAVLLEKLEHVADQVIGDVFETFSKHPRREGDDTR
jgi:hypothetical protein